MSPHYGGPEGIRTLDLSDANRTLSQLSYKPMLQGVARPAQLLYTFCARMQAFSYLARKNSLYSGSSPSPLPISASAQSDRDSSTGSSRRQRSVGLYSTRTGTSGYACRRTSPSRSSSRRAAASTVLLMPSSFPRRVL